MRFCTGYKVCHSFPQTIPDDMEADEDIVIGSDDDGQLKSLQQGESEVFALPKNPKMVSKTLFRSIVI